MKLEKKKKNISTTLTLLAVVKEKSLMPTGCLACSCPNWSWACCCTKKQHDQQWQTSDVALHWGESPAHAFTGCCGCKRQRVCMSLSCSGWGACRSWVKRTATQELFRWSHRNHSRWWQPGQSIRWHHHRLRQPDCLLYLVFLWIKF